MSAGAVVSRTITVNLALALFPRASVAVQVTDVAVIGNVVPEAGEQLGAMLPFTRSLADAENVTAAPLGPVASVVMSAGTVTTGGVVSRTMMLKVLVALVLPEASVAEQLTTVVVIGNVLPDPGAQVTAGAGSTRSEANAKYVMTAPLGPVASAGGSTGTVTVGAVLSWTVTVNEFVPMFPELSVAEHVTVLCPSGNVLPDAGAQLGVMLPSMLSDADAE
jgi:hypothetical protein